MTNTTHSADSMLTNAAKISANISAHKSYKVTKMDRMDWIDLHVSETTGPVPVSVGSVRVYPTNSGSVAKATGLGWWRELI